MNARIASVLFTFALFCVLAEIAGLPTTVDAQDLREKLVDQDQQFQKCCRSLRETDPRSDCKSCDDQLEPLEPVTENQPDGEKTFGVPCLRMTHTGCRTS